jgi:hypothetical protein
MHWEQSEIDKMTTNVREIDSLLQWSAETVVELQHLYTRELTHLFSSKMVHVKLQGA